MPGTKNKFIKKLQQETEPNKNKNENNWSILHDYHKESRRRIYTRYKSQIDTNQNKTFSASLKNSKAFKNYFY